MLEKGGAVKWLHLLHLLRIFTCGADIVKETSPSKGGDAYLSYDIINFITRNISALIL